LQKLTHIDINEGTPQWHSRNYFNLSFCLIGISIVDLCLLTKDNINNGRLTYKRRKTGKWYDIKLQPEAINILAIYQGYSKYLLPIADHSATTEERLIKSIKYKTKVINKHLAQLVNIPLTNK
jgi:integrase/recombinase XerD